METNIILSIAELFIAAMSGPAAATVILGCMLIGIGYGFFKYAIPAMRDVLDSNEEIIREIISKKEEIVIQHKKALEEIVASNEKNLNRILEEHKEDREVWKESFKEIAQSVRRVETRLEDIENVLNISKRHG